MINIYELLLNLKLQLLEKKKKKPSHTQVIPFPKLFLILMFSE